MNQFLVWLNQGGDIHAPCTQEYYRICKGDEEEDAVREWVAFHHLDMEKVEFKYKGWKYDGSKLNVIELIKTNGYAGWKKLKWVTG